MSRTGALLAVLAILALAALTACGSSDSGGSSTSDKSAATSAETTAAAPATAASAPTTTAPTGKNATVVTACHKAFDPFIAELREINNDLAAVPTYYPYLAATRKLKRDYRKFDLKKIPSTSCQTAVGGPAAGAFGVHVMATERWTKCIERHDCIATIVRLHTQWAKATKLTNDATKAFNTVTSS